MYRQWSESEAVHETDRIARVQDEAEAHAERERFRRRVYGDGHQLVSVDGQDRFNGYAGGKPRRPSRRLQQPIDPTVQRMVEWTERRMIELGFASAAVDQAVASHLQVPDPPAPPATPSTQLTLGLE